MSECRLLPVINVPLALALHGNGLRLLPMINVPLDILAGFELAGVAFCAVTFAIGCSLVPPIAPQGLGEFLYLTFLIYINIICRFSHLRRSEELAAATLRAYAAAACSPALLSSFLVFPLMFSLSCSLAFLLYFLFPLWLYICSCSLRCCAACSSECSHNFSKYRIT